MSKVFIDAHVHIYECFDLSKLLTSAYQNLSAAAFQRRFSHLHSAFLLLAETAQERCFQLLCSYADHNTALEGGGGGVPWRFQRLDEDPCAVLALKTTGERLTLVAGRQIVTAEGLEVLALGTNLLLTDGLQTEETLQLVADSGGIAVLPWGVGKWFGRRGTLVTEFLQTAPGISFLLGDNGGRPTFWPEPLQFSQARALGIKILSGTDPLPMPLEAHRVGSFGSILSGEVSSVRPSRSLIRLLQQRDAELEPYGELERPLRFFRKQLGLRLARKRSRRLTAQVSGR